MSVVSRAKSAIGDIFREVWTDDVWTRHVGEPVRVSVFDARTERPRWWRWLLLRERSQVTVLVSLTPGDRRPTSETEPFYVYGKFSFPIDAKARDIAHDMDEFAVGLADEYRALHLA